MVDRQPHNVRQQHNSESPIRVGLLHSLTGTMAMSEAALQDAELMAIAEINQSGGVLGCPIEPVMADGASDPSIFERQARHLIQVDKVVTLFGCWSSAGRKLVIPVLEQFNILLWYPIQYEGLECSEHVFYTGACPNQQIEPAVDWLLQTRGRRFYLLGMDYVYPRVANKIIRAQLKSRGAEVVGEAYPALGAKNFRGIIADIQRIAPDVVFSTLNGDSNIPFYHQYHEAGLTASVCPVMSASVGEDQFLPIGEAAAGHYAVWSYFQSLDSPANQRFVQNFQNRYGRDRVTSDPIEAAYTQVYLWKQAVEAAGSVESDRVRCAAYGQTFEAPSGLVRIEPNHHLWKNHLIGQILPNGQVNILERGDRAIKPMPWLGVGDIPEFDRAPLVIDLLAEVPQVIQYSCQLAQKSQELETALEELQTVNHYLQQTQLQVQTLSEREELLKRRLSVQIRSSLDLTTIVNTAVHEIRELMQIDSCRFFWYQPSQPLDLVEEAYRSDVADLVQHSLIPVTQVLGPALRTHQQVRINDLSDTSDLPESHSHQLHHLGLTSLLVLLIQTHAGKVGVIACEQYRSRHVWGDGEVDLLKDVADQLAIAIEQAELYNQSRIAAATANQQAEQLRQAMEELQQAQLQLIQTEKMSSLGQLVAGIAHEINNPVNFIHGNLNHATAYTQDLLQLVRLYQATYAATPELQDYAESVDLEFLLEDLPQLFASMQIGAERIRQIVLSLRNFSRLDEADMKQVDIHEGIDNTLLILQNRWKPHAHHRGIDIIKHYGQLPLIECYAGQLNQVFMNILSNSLDALEEITKQSDSNATESIPTITIRTERINASEIVIAIADNGHGIPDAIQQKLFDPFFTTKTVGKGTGLGLSISYQIVVEKHRGRLHCRSQPGQGAEFLIQIPIHQSQSMATAAAVSAVGRSSNCADIPQPSAVPL